MLMNHKRAILILLFAGLPLLAGLAASGPLAQQASGIVPGLWRGEVARPRPDMTGLPPLRILTEADYPPFNYYDEDGTLTGFNVELMQAVCAVMEVACSFEVRDFESLLPSLQRGEADIVSASLSINPDNLKIADFSERYYETPARFIGKKSREIADVTPEIANGLRIGVMAGSQHENYLRNFFPGVVAMPMKDRDELREALVQDRVDLIFDDGITSVFWLNGTASKGCCAFRGGPYMDTGYFGDGVGFAIRKGERRLREIVNYALEKVRRDGTYEELFLRYFPLSFY
jgi:polar amino acid transport system substrate-binding protein